MNIGGMIPYISVVVLVLIAVVIGIGYFIMRKKKPLTAASIPPIPNSKEASGHFDAKNTPLPTTATMNGPMAGAGAKNKKMIIGGVMLAITVTVILVVSYLVSSQKPQPTKPKAAAPEATNIYVHRENTIGRVQGNDLIAGALFGYYQDQGPQPVPTPSPITITVTVRLFWCKIIHNPTSCAEPAGVDVQHAILNWNDRQVEITGGITMDQHCGVYQVDSNYSPYNPNEPNPGEAGSAFYNWGESCPTPTPDISATPTVPPLATPSPTISSNPSTTPTRTPTPSPTPTVSITPAPNTSVTPTATPKPTSTLTPTPTTGVGTPTSTPTPTPTEIILAQSSSTPAPTAVTIPSAGTPIPLFAIGLPLIIILFAFLL